MERSTAYKMIKTKHLGGHWFLDMVDYAKGWHGEGYWKHEFKLNKLERGDVLTCSIVNNKVEIRFTCKKFKQEHVDVMDSLIADQMSENSELITDEGMPDNWFSRVKKRCGHKKAEAEINPPRPKEDD